MIRFGFISFFHVSPVKLYNECVYSFFLQRAVSPCFGGMLSDLVVRCMTSLTSTRLNPCSNGILSDFLLFALVAMCSVLILVLMEYSLTLILGGTLLKSMCLNPCSNGILSDLMKDNMYVKEVSLNPCSNGILSDFG